MKREELEATLWLWDLGTLIAAARERFAQLPEKCETCGGTGIAGTYHNVNRETGEHAGNQDITCPACHGRGVLYPPALVERINKAIYETVDRWITDYSALGPIVLDALNETGTE